MLASLRPPSLVPPPNRPQFCASSKPVPTPLEPFGSLYHHPNPSPPWIHQTWSNRPMAGWIRSQPRLRTTLSVGPCDGPVCRVRSFRCRLHRDVLHPLFLVAEQVLSSAAPFLCPIPLLPYPQDIPRPILSAPFEPIPPSCMPPN